MGIIFSSLGNEYAEYAVTSRVSEGVRISKSKCSVFVAVFGHFLAIFKASE